MSLITEFDSRVIRQLVREMARLATLYDVSGVVNDVLPPNKAVIGFLHEGKLNSALLTNSQFYYEGKHIPANRVLSDYLRAGVTVKFSCETSQETKKDTPCRWVITTCWCVDKNPLNRVTITRGVDDVLGKVKKLGGRHGIISVFDGTKYTHDILFLASRFYVDGKRFPAGKTLTAGLHEGESVFVDAIPCIPEENDECCSWFATCVFKGRRPKIIHDNGHDNGHKVHRGEIGHQVEETDSFRSQYLEFVNLYVYNPHTVYVTGAGTILRILDEEFGIIIGEFKKNVFQTVLFHRKHFFMFGTNLVPYDIRALLYEEDRVKFVVVGAPPGFATEWIAVQVSIQRNSDA
ncbi:uncharacterized protein LOC107041120 [Diachasma alloeum]|uniref:uncharacterized protein LOC107041120 n=1 Tax=Diachasma alloeum TaxID=454923 RepID=UPI00073812B4|nr:uncharacterized protein LOC107041120 [Diachasma alloeum]